MCCTMLPIIQVFLLVCVYTVFSVEQGEGSTEIVEPKHKPVYVLNGTSFEMKCIQYDCEEVTWRKGVGVNEKEINQTLDSGFSFAKFENMTKDSENGESKCRYFTNILTKEHVDLSDADTYSCRPAYQTTNISDSFYTTVIVFTISPVDGEYVQWGKDVKLKCDVKQLTQIPRMEWKRNGKTLKQGEKYSMNITYNYLTIHRSTEEDIGEYSCYFVLLNKTYSEVVNLWAKAFVQPFDERSYTYIRGSDMQLKCDVWGHPKPTIIWRRIDSSNTIDDISQDLPYSDAMLNNSNNVQLASKRLTFSEGVLNISNIGDDDSGEYVCIASNPRGHTKHKVIFRVKGHLAALWPFIGIVIELIILIAIILFFERRDKSRKAKEEGESNAQQHVSNSTVHGSKSDVRHRK